MRAVDYHQIIQLFTQYSEKAKVVTLPGFRRYLLEKQAFPAWIVRSLMSQITRDDNLYYHITSIMEADLVEGSCIGSLKEGAVKLVLKRYCGYKENYEDTRVNQVATNINLKLAQKPKKDENQTVKTQNKEQLEPKIK